MKKLTDKVFGGIYSYRRNDNKEVVYSGSTKLTPSRKEDTIFESADAFHRKGETFNQKWSYSWTVFRTNLRRPLGDILEQEVTVKPRWMTLEELLTLERDAIQSGIKKGQNYLNHDPDPLKTWIKHNG